jgi:hypothetical protein
MAAMFTRNKFIGWYVAREKGRGTRIHIGGDASGTGSS